MLDCYFMLWCPQTYLAVPVPVAGNTINFRFVCQGNLAGKKRESGPVL